MKHYQGLGALAGAGMLLAAAAAAAADSNVLSLPGVTADRTAQTVRVRARATGVAPNAQAEFLLIAPNSGHDYESIAVAEAKAADIHRALEFLGVNPGRPVDPMKLHFWPRGERVRVDFEWKPAGAATACCVRAEETILDRRTGRPLPAEGFVFTGSEWLAAEGATNAAREYAADTLEPNSIVSLFNLGGSVFDIPRRGTQGELYDYQVANPAHAFPTNAPLEVVFRPEPRSNGVPRAADVTLAVEPPAAGAPGLRYGLRDAGGRALSAGPALDMAATALDALAAQGREPFVTVRIDSAVRLAQLGGLGEAVVALVERHGARIEPPPEGQLYYKAFAPDPTMRDRAERIAQPWELRVRAEGGAVTGVLTKIERNRDLVTDQPTFETKDFPCGSPAALRAALDRNGPGLPVIIVYAPAAMAYGELASFLRPALPTHPVIHVFAE